MINTESEFLKDETLKRAFSRSLEIIGEASKKITADNQLKWPQIQWKQIAGMRDRLVHDYTGIDYELVWDIAINKIPDLKRQIEEIIETAGKGQE